MKRLLAFIVFLCLLGSIIILAVKAGTNRKWNAEPTSFLGIRLDHPITDSIPVCKQGSTSICFDGPPVTDGDLIVENASDELGLVRIFIQGNKVGEIDASISESQSDLIRQQLLEKYGRPQHGDAISDEMGWNGKVLSIYFRKIKTGNYWDLTASSNLSAYHPQIEVRNPF